MRRKVRGRSGLGFEETKQRPRKKLKPNLDEKMTSSLNFTVLRRIDPAVVDILGTFSHVILYDFNAESGKWDRKGVEGPLFVVKRNVQPRFHFMVMNRLSTDNFMENILGNFQTHVHDQFLIYGNAAGPVTGTWFYNPDEWKAFSKLFDRILKVYPKGAPMPEITSSKREPEDLQPPTSSADIIPGSSDDSLANLFTTAVSAWESSLSSGISLVPGLPRFKVESGAAATATPAIQTDTPESSSNHTANLARPLPFVSPRLSTPLPTISTSAPNSPPLHSPLNLPRSYDTPLPLFLPPQSQPLVTPLSLTANHSPFITRDLIRQAVLRIVQKEEFIDMLYEELQRAQI